MGDWEDINWWVQNRLQDLDFKARRQCSRSASQTADLNASGLPPLNYVCPSLKSLRMHNTSSCTQRRLDAEQAWQHHWPQPFYDDCLKCEGPVWATAPGTGTRGKGQCRWRIDPIWSISSPGNSPAPAVAAGDLTKCRNRSSKGWTRPGEYAGSPLVLISAYRCRQLNMLVGGSTHSSHLKGLAVDIAVGGSGMRYAIHRTLMQAGFNRFGLGTDFIHVDADPDKPQGVEWLYQ